MKKKHQILVGVLVAIILIATASCEDISIKSGCNNGGAVIHTVDQVEGSISYNEDLNARVITYFVPGTIDSAWSGVICDSTALEFDVKEDQRVRFSGNFIDDNDELQPRIVFGGQGFFYLELTSIELIF